MRIAFFLPVAFLFQLNVAHAVTFLDPAEGRREGRQLVDKLLSLQPDGNSTNFGVLKIRDANKKTKEVPVKFLIVVTPTNWQSIYETTSTNSDPQKLIVSHNGKGPNVYESFHRDTNSFSSLMLGGKVPIGDAMLIPFAGSDFSFGDLGLEFLHWPEQRIIKKQVHRSCGCSLLESINPDPKTKGYARVESWIDNDSGGIMDAEAFDVQGKRLKIFEAKSVAKVNGQWQVEEMELRNDQTESRTLIKFDFDRDE